LLIQGARSSVQRAKAVAIEKATPEQRWIRTLEQRPPFGQMLVAIATNTPGRSGPCSRDVPLVLSSTEVRRVTSRFHGRGR
jgi:hypothetical protein